MLRQLFAWVAVATLVGIVIVAAWTKVVWVGQQGVLYTRRGGRNLLLPGPHFIGPGARITRVGTRLRTFDVTALPVVTKDFQTVTVDATVLACVRAADLTLEFRDIGEAMDGVCHAAVRAVAATHPLDDLVFDGEAVQEAICTTLRAWTGELSRGGPGSGPDWGMQVLSAALKRVSRPAEGPVYPLRPAGDASTPASPVPLERGGVVPRPMGA